MNLQHLTANFAEYHLWANQQFVNWLAEQTDEKLQQEVASSFSSILSTLNHIWAIDEYWVATINQRDAFENRYGITDFKRDEIFQGLISRSVQFVADVKAFTEEELTTALKVVRPWLETTQARYEFILQMVNHGTHHRGQIVTIARNAGITDVPNTDYVFFNAAR